MYVQYAEGPSESLVDDRPTRILCGFDIKDADGRTDRISVQYRKSAILRHKRLISSLQRGKSSRRRSSSEHTEQRAFNCNGRRAVAMGERAVRSPRTRYPREREIE